MHSLDLIDYIDTRHAKLVGHRNGQPFAHPCKGRGFGKAFHGKDKDGYRICRMEHANRADQAGVYEKCASSLHADAAPKVMHITAVT
jgi:hypothetical protein